MQLKQKRTGQFREKLAALSAGLLAAALATPEAKGQQQVVSANDNFGPGVAYTEIDSAILVYKEAGGRVQAVEPALDLTTHGAEEQVLNFGIVADTVSGATPNGAVPSDVTQTFVTPVKVRASSTTGGGNSRGGEGGDDGGAGSPGGGGTPTMTGASGGSTLVQVAGQTVRQYTVAPNTLPVDKGFRDQRYGFHFSYSQPLGPVSLVGFGGGYSVEHDYRAITANVRLAQAFNSNNTTVSLALNIELDRSFPYGGVPIPLTVMNGTLKTPSARSKTQLGFVVGITQAMTRRWLTELDYSFDTQTGYQNDPYRILSVVDPTTGEPNSYLYEARPGHRQSQSLFWDNKIDFDPAVTDVSLRYFRDSWGISSVTAELAERVPLTSYMYVEPSARWYHQSAANFFHYYLVSGQSLPAYASSDTRLSGFSSLTYGAKVGFNLTGATEFYVRAGYYEQTGSGHLAGAIGQLKAQNLFGGTKAAFVFVGFSWDFR